MRSSDDLLSEKIITKYWKTCWHFKQKGFLQILWFINSGPQIGIIPLILSFIFIYLLSFSLILFIISNDLFWDTVRSIAQQHKIQTYPNRDVSVFLGVSFRAVGGSNFDLKSQNIYWKTSFMIGTWKHCNFYVVG